MEYLAAHAGYTRVHNPATGEKDFVRLPGVVAIAYQHETSRAGDPHLHTHVIVPNRQPRADGKLVAIDGTSLYHEARAAGVIYQATLRRELHRSLGLEWAPVDPATGMAELAGVDPASITAWSQRSTQLRQWAAHNLVVVDGRAGRRRRSWRPRRRPPARPNPSSWRGRSCGSCGARMRADCGCIGRALTRPGPRGGRRRGRRSIGAGSRTWRRRSTRRRSPAPTWWRSSARSCRSTPNAPRDEVVEAAVDEIGMRLTGPRAAHQREGHERFTLDRILAEEAVLLDLVDARDVRAQLWITEQDTAGLSADQKRAVREHRRLARGWCAR